MKHRQFPSLKMLTLARALGLVFFSAATAVAQTGQIKGEVVDTSGAPVPGATVTASTSGQTPAKMTTANDGTFSFTDLAGEATITAAANGFATNTLQVSPTATAPLVIVLRPAALVDSVTVTATRGAERLETPAATTVLTSAELLNSAAGTIDDALRNTPGFSLFRRSSSRVANPTTQGVTLRGVSGSGASRTLVLADGLPLNDPFGSWVYWNRIPQAAIDRVEVVRGAAGDLYGPDALGGVVQVLTFSPGRARLRASMEGGSHDTARGSFFGGGQARGWTATAAGEWLESDGVPIIAEESRGLVDVPADSDYRTGYVAVGYDRGSWHATGRASAFQEERGNGTPLQVNDTNWRQYSGDAGGALAGGAWTAHAAGGTQRYYQTFTAVAADRNSERLTTSQRVPIDFNTVGGQWVRSLGTHTFLVGAETKHTESTVEETRVAVNGVVTGPFFFGGRETSSALYGRASFALASRLTVAVGARGDFWDSDPDDAALSEKSVNFFSPRASVAYRWTPAVSIHGAVYRAYRTPTLNELHRGFRVGNVLTNANPLLEPERLTGFEASALISRARTSARVTGFVNYLADSIANITLTTTPALITRERQNADQVRAAGLEIEADFRVHPTLTVTGLAVVTNSIFNNTPKQPTIEGNRVPQVPRYQLGAGATYADPRIATLSAQLRVVGSQFDDDVNEFELESFGVLDVYASRTVVGNVNAFFAVENLFDTEYDTGRTPIRTIGWPRSVRAGVRVFLP